MNWTAVRSAARPVERAHDHEDAEDHARAAGCPARRAASASEPGGVDGAAGREVPRAPRRTATNTARATIDDRRRGPPSCPSPNHWKPRGQVLHPHPLGGPAQAFAQHRPSWPASRRSTAGRARRRARRSSAPSKRPGDDRAQAHQGHRAGPPWRAGPRPRRRSRTASRSRCRSAGPGSRASCPIAATRTGALPTSEVAQVRRRRRSGAATTARTPSRARAARATDSSRAMRAGQRRSMAAPPTAARVPEGQGQDRSPGSRSRAVEDAHDRARRASRRCGRSCPGSRAARTRS